MARLFGHHEDPAQSRRFDAALARNLAANERASQAADEVVEAASASRKRTEETGSRIRDTIKRRVTPTGRQQASDVRQLVDELVLKLARDSEDGRC